MPSHLVCNILLKERDSPSSVAPGCLSVSAHMPSQDFRYSVGDRTLHLKLEDLGWMPCEWSATSHSASGRTLPTQGLGGVQRGPRGSKEKSSFRNEP